MGPVDANRKWTELLSDEELSFIKRFVLASGSLKKMASVYGVSYPTVRLRLDRLIAKVTVADSQEITSHFERVLRTQYAEGRIDMNALKALQDAHKRELEDKHENSSRND